MSVPALEIGHRPATGSAGVDAAVIAVDGAVERTQGGWIATGVPYVYDTEKWDGIRGPCAGGSRPHALLRRRARLPHGVPAAGARRSRPGAVRAVLGVHGRPPRTGSQCSPEAIQAAQAFVRGVDVVIEPRKMWPPRLSDGRKGRIKGATTGRALTFADTPGWSEAASAAAGSDGPLSDEIINGMVAVLGRWRATWDQRPVAIVPMPSRRHGTMIGHLAESIGRIGKLPVIDLLDAFGPPPPDDAPSGPKVEALLGGLRLVDAAKVPTDGPLLLMTTPTVRGGP